jgi:Tol biopolymer transport system component
MISQRYPGLSDDPEPSPDGTRVAFLAYPGSRSREVVVVRDLGTGKESMYPASARYLKWAPDSRRLLLMRNGRTPNTQELTWLDVDSGKTQPFRNIEPARNPLTPVFSRDGRTLYFVFCEWPGTDWRVMAMDVATGEQREILKVDGGLGGLSLSPDGQTLATMRSLGAKDPHSFQLLLVPVTGGQAKVAATMQVDMARAGSFLPDGKRVLVLRHLSTQSPKQEIVAVDLATGKAEPINLEQDAKTVYWTLDPSGKRILFSAGLPESEIWVAENILPAK